MRCKENLTIGAVGHGRPPLAGRKLAARFMKNVEEA
jgi:hypothetical protein